MKEPIKVVPKDRIFVTLGARESQPQPDDIDGQVVLVDGFYDEGTFVRFAGWHPRDVGEPTANAGEMTNFSSCFF